MQVRLVHLAPGALDHESLWASVGTLAAGLACTWLAWVGPLPIACPFHWLTGLPCPTCGSTRALLALLSGDLAGSLRYHPAVAPAVAAGAVAWAYAWVVVALRLPRVRVRAGGRAATVARWTVAAAVGGIWVIQILRGL